MSITSSEPALTPPSGRAVVLDGRAVAARVQQAVAARANEFAAKIETLG